MLNDYIPYGRQYISDDDIKAVVDVLNSDWLTQGPMIERFEQSVAKYCGAKKGVAFSSGTAALHAACYAAGISPGDEVITSPMTFVASANGVLYCGGKPVFADIEMETGNINPKELEKKITGKTKAIIPVHFAGQPCDIDKIHKIARKHDLFIIEDAAHALGAEYKGKKIGSLSDMTIFSFHPVKHITTGEGGMALTNNKVFYEKLLLFRNHGITKDLSQMEKNEGPWYYEMIDLGYNYRITDIQSALGISQMKKLNNFLKKRRSIAAEYRKYLKKELENIVTPLKENDDGKHAYHLFPVKINFKKIGISRSSLIVELKKMGIGTQVHYIPVHLQPYYRKTFKWKTGDMPVAENFYNQILSLPIYPSMPGDGVKRVVNSLKNILSGKK
jgi:UDP-4-amino-4,6-dideoxy-N-acetyl-beta-L-altrosamine transaminase